MEAGMTLGGNENLPALLSKLARTQTFGSSMILLTLSTPSYTAT